MLSGASTGAKYRSGGPGSHETSRISCSTTLDLSNPSMLRTVLREPSARFASIEKQARDERIRPATSRVRPESRSIIAANVCDSHSHAAPHLPLRRDSRADSDQHRCSTRVKSLSQLIKKLKQCARIPRQAAARSNVTYCQVHAVSKVLQQLRRGDLRKPALSRVHECHRDPPPLALPG